MQLNEFAKIPESKLKQFKNKGIESVEDLALYFPRSYHDFTEVTGLVDGELSVIEATVMTIEGGTYGSRVLTALCKHPSLNRNLRVSWFNQNYLKTKLYATLGKNVLIAGKASYSPQYDNWQIVAPIIFTTDIKHGRAIYPVYPKIRGMSDEYLKNTMDLVLPTFEYNEFIPTEVLRAQKLPNFKESVLELHNPKTMQRLELAKKRIIFNELLYFAAKMELASRRASKGSQYNIKTLTIYNKVRESLPYELTPDQDAAIKGLIKSAKDGRRINALVQGDVGCGKSIIAFLAMLAFYESGYQSVLMAPTQVLAKQHYADLSALVEPFGIEVVFLGGEKMKAAEERALLKKIETGEAKLIVGTHAVISQKVKYKNLALAITDEEHKFGVLQREALVSTFASGTHAITMSATPIPRSLAAIVYGNGVELYTIKTMPAGRKPVKTCTTRSMKAIFKFLLKELGEGKQAYVVCPMIDKNDEMMEGVASVEEISKTYTNILGNAGYKVEALTGKNTTQETVDVLNRFKNNETQVIIATTVIEVGVNVPNATTIVIHNAERFGLSSLHQLRGRVGRGTYQGYCVLESPACMDNKRLDVMCQTTNGYEIAKEDLKQRGAGELIGTKQHGGDAYINLMMAYPEWYNEIKDIASELIDNGRIEPLLQMKELREQAAEAGSAAQKRAYKAAGKTVVGYAED